MPVPSLAVGLAAAFVVILIGLITSSSTLRLPPPPVPPTLFQRVVNTPVIAPAVRLAVAYGVLTPPQPPPPPPTLFQRVASMPLIAPAVRLAVEFGVITSPHVQLPPPPPTIFQHVTSTPLLFLTAGLAVACALIGIIASSGLLRRRRRPPPTPTRYADNAYGRQTHREWEARQRRGDEQELQRQANSYADALRQHQQDQIRRGKARATATAAQSLSDYSDDDDPVDPRENVRYVSLRDRAREQSEAMKNAYDQAGKARRSNNSALAKMYAQQGREFEDVRDQLNAQASTWIYQELNAKLPRNEIDLHCQYVSEAIQRTDKAVTAALGRGDAKVRIIVGKGLHSAGRGAKLGPAVQSHLQKQSFTVRPDPRNAGVLEVTL